MARQMESCGYVTLILVVVRYEDVGNACFNINSSLKELEHVAESC